MLLGLFALAMLIVIKWLNYRWLLKRSWTVLELTPPAGSDKAPVATQRLFSVLHGLDASRSPLERVLRRKVLFSFEVVSTKKAGIRFLIRVPESEARIIEQTIHSYMPDVKCREGNDYDDFGYKVRRQRVVEVFQSGHFGYPLSFQGEFEQHDPMGYLAGAMTHLKDDELMAIQLVVSPANVPEARTIASRILHNEELVYSLGQRKSSADSRLLGFLSNMSFKLLEAVGELTSGTSRNDHRGMNVYDEHYSRQIGARIRPARVLSIFEQKLAENVQNKLNQPLFRVNIRAVVAAGTQESEKQRVKALRDWLSLFVVPGYQAVRSRIDWPWMRRVRLHSFWHRLPALRISNPAILSASELAELYHFPHSQTARVENVIKSLSKTLPAPISLKGGEQFDVVIGRNRHHGIATDIGLTAAERERHVYVIGGTGNGKTTMLEYGIIQDIRNGKGVAVIDPHGDLSAKLLRFIPEDRIDDVIYFNPSDLGYPIGLNLLELPEGLEGDDLIDAKDFLTEAVISIMRKVFSSDDTGGHRIEYVLRNTVHTALTLENPTLFTIFDLLINPKFAKKVAKELKDPKLKNFWLNEMGKAGDFQRVKMAAGVTAKIGRFQFSASAERILSQPKSTINFEDVLDGKILICNFAKGLIGEDTSELFGISTLAKLQLAAYRRVKQEQSERKPFYLYVDEFQNFATMSFVQMLSEARKYRVFLTMAEQTTSQQDDPHMVNTILANVGTVISFRSGNPTDEAQILPLFEPYISRGEIASLPSFNFYARLSAVTPQEPVSGETILMYDAGSSEVASRVVDHSRSNYAHKHLALTASKMGKNNQAMQQVLEAAEGARPA